MRDALDGDHPVVIHQTPIEVDGAGDIDPGGIKAVGGQRCEANGTAKRDGEVFACLVCSRLENKFKNKER